MDEGQTVEIESVKNQTTGFDAVAIPDEQPTISKKAVKAQLKFAREAVKAHIAALTGKALSKAYKANCDTKKAVSLSDKRKAVKAIIDELPENIIEKMVEGRLRKFYEESVLLEQTFIMDADKKIKDVIAEAQKELGTAVALTGFVRFALGEGIDKKEEDFAEEVKKAMG